MTSFVSVFCKLCVSIFKQFVPQSKSDQTTNHMQEHNQQEIVQFEREELVDERHWTLKFGLAFVGVIFEVAKDVIIVWTIVQTGRWLYNSFF